MLIALRSILIFAKRQVTQIPEACAESQTMCYTVAPAPTQFSCLGMWLRTWPCRPLRSSSEGFRPQAISGSKHDQLLV